MREERLLGWRTDLSTRGSGGAAGAADVELLRHVRRVGGATALGVIRVLAFCKGDGALWPLLHGATAFFLALLRQRNGNGDDGTPLQWGPSHSPENAWMDGAGATHFLAYEIGARRRRGLTHV